MGDEKYARVIWKHGMTFSGTSSGAFTVSMDDGPDGFSPMELVLIALAGCTAMDILMILEKKRQTVTGFEVRAHGVRTDTYPRVFTAITLEYVLQGDLEPSAVETALALSRDKYCSVMGMLKQSVEIQTAYLINPVMAES